MIYDRINYIFTKEEINRLSIEDTPGNMLKVTVDVHGMKCSQAKRLINNLINVLRTSFVLRIIHGFNHGTAIRDMLSESFDNPHVAKKYLDPRNQGITFMQIAA